MSKWSILGLENSSRAGSKISARFRVRKFSCFSQKEIAQLTQTSIPTVHRICNRYAEEGLQASLEEKPRPGAIPKITGEIEAKIMLLACSEPPKGAARWTLSLLKNQVVAEGLLPSVGRTTLGDRLKKMRPNPGRSNGTAFPKRTRIS